MSCPACIVLGSPWKGALAAFQAGDGGGGFWNCESCAKGDLPLTVLARDPGVHPSAG